MKELVKTINTKGETVCTIDSREVAEMLGKEHKYILRDSWNSYLLLPL